MDALHCKINPGQAQIAGNMLCMSVFMNNSPQAFGRWALQPHSQQVIFIARQSGWSATGEMPYLFYHMRLVVKQAEHFAFLFVAAVCIIQQYSRPDCAIFAHQLFGRAAKIIADDALRLPP